MQLKPEQAAQAARPGMAPQWLTDAVQRDTGTPFDLGKPPLLRATIIQGAPAGNLMVLVIHHAIIDG